MGLLPSPFFEGIAIARAAEVKGHHDILQTIGMTTMPRYGNARQQQN